MQLTNGLKSSAKPVFKILLSLSLAFSSSLMLTGCIQSETDKCIDEQSHLWNNKAKTKAENKMYWDAVAQCKEKYK